MSSGFSVPGLSFDTLWLCRSGVIKGLEASGQGDQLAQISHHYQMTSSANNALENFALAEHEMDMAQLASDRAAQLQRQASDQIVFGTGLQAREVNEALGDDLPWWAKVASFIPEMSAAVPALR